MKFSMGTAIYQETPLYTVQDRGISWYFVFHQNVKKTPEDINICPNILEISMFAIVFFLKALSSYPRSRGSTFRSREKPLGRPDSECVRLGNLLCARALFLIVLAASKKVWWILEQPMSSVMEWHPLFQAVIKLLGMRKMLVSMSKFGGPTDKKTYLYSRDLFAPSILCFGLKMEKLVKGSRAI